MILHVTFTDGSNPWVFYGDQHEVAKHWRRWMKYHPNTARPWAMVNGWKCGPVAGGGFAVGRYFDGAHKTYYFERLGDALRALDRLGNGG